MSTVETGEDSFHIASLSQSLRECALYSKCGLPGYFYYMNTLQNPSRNSWLLYNVQMKSSHPNQSSCILRSLNFMHQDQPRWSDNDCLLWIAFIVLKATLWEMKCCCKDWKV